MSEYHYGQFSPKHMQAMLPGLMLFNSGQFWECHEFLEELWLEDKADNARLIYWAIIQVAACLYHVENKNLVGAWGMIHKCLNKFERAEALGVETPLLEEIHWNQLKILVRSIPKNGNIQDYDLLHQFKFPNIVGSQ